MLEPFLMNWRNDTQTKRQWLLSGGAVGAAVVIATTVIAGWRMAPRPLKAGRALSEREMSSIRGAGCPGCSVTPQTNCQQQDSCTICQGASGGAQPAQCSTIGTAWQGIVYSTCDKNPPMNGQQCNTTPRTCSYPDLSCNFNRPNPKPNMKCSNVNNKLTCVDSMNPNDLCRACATGDIDMDYPDTVTAGECAPCGS